MKSTANITIIDYGMGNIRSVHNALARLGCAVTTSNRAEDIAAADALILPGVGAFGEAMTNLNASGLTTPLLRAVLDDAKPILGICLGMQLLAETSEERGMSRGLGLIPGDIRLIPVPKNLRLPHIGWNSVTAARRDPLFRGVPDGSAFYFVHSFHFECPSEYVAATTEYGGDVVAAVQKGHVMGVQFHPERSQSCGLSLLANFIAHATAITAEGTRAC